MGEHSFPGWKTRWFCLDFQSRFTYSRRHCTGPWCLIHILRGMVTSLPLIIPRGYSLANLKHLGSWIICVYFITLLRKSKEWSPWLLLFYLQGNRGRKKALTWWGASSSRRRESHTFLFIVANQFISPGKSNSLILSHPPSSFLLHKKSNTSPINICLPSYNIVTKT